MALRPVTIAATVLGLASTCPTFADTPTEAVKSAHSAYLAAINSNDLDVFLGAVTDDIVFIAPDTPVMVGKSEVAPWVGGYFEAVQTLWHKQPLEIVVADGWAFERYVYKATDIPRGGRTAQIATGHGFNIYRLEDDGVWRVARDIWSSTPVDPDAFSDSAVDTCSGIAEPC